MKLTVANPRCEYLTNPLGIDELTPRLSWELQSSGKGVMQQAYQVLVADCAEALKQGKGNLWDSGKVESDASNQIEYAGKKLKVFQFCYWKVMVWDNQGNESSWSKVGKWSIGPLKRDDWNGKWISYPVSAVHDSAFLRTTFSISKKVKRATLYATAKGLYEMEINGKKIGDDVFTPGWTDYNKRLYYNTYDVTSNVKKGKNAIGGVLGEGWYKGPIGFQGSTNCYGDRPQLLANLRLEYADGTSECVATDDNWKTSLGPILQSTFLMGETYDARQELTGWSLPKYKDQEWQRVTCFGLTQKYWDNSVMAEVCKPELIEAYPCEPVKHTETFKPIEIWESTPGSWVFDLGQNFAGRVKLKVKGSTGTIIRLRFGEMVTPQKTLYVENLRSAVSTDTYICKGDGVEEWEPRFTFHGFRYVEVTGIKKKPSKDMITGIVLGSATTRVGQFSCNDKMVNQLYSNLVWTQRANFLEVPTDCPQRDERLGWTGDAQVYIRTAICNMDVAAFFKKWMVDLEDTQNPKGAVTNVAPSSFLVDQADSAWGDAMTVCPWTIYECYGDTRILSKHYDAMTKWVGYLKDTSKDLVRGDTHCFGDWLSINADTPKPVIQTAFFAYSSLLTAKAAKVLGKRADAKKFEALYDDVCKAFCKEFVAKDGKITGDTQTVYILALHFNLIPEEMKPKAVKHLVKNIKDRGVHLSTGFVGTPYLLHVLTAYGHLDIAYQLLLNKTYPSWLYSVKNGATTIWERWNGWKKGEGCGDANMNSFSHYAYGSVGEWMFNTVAGLDHASPSFKEITIKPQPGSSIKQATAEYNSIYGKVASSWKLKKDKFVLEVTIPVNTTAEVTVPKAKKQTVTVDGKPLADVKYVTVVCEKDDCVVAKVGSGAYSFKAE